MILCLFSRQEQIGNSPGNGPGPFPPNAFFTKGEFRDGNRTPVKTGLAPASFVGFRVQPDGTLRRTRRCLTAACRSENVSSEATWNGISFNAPQCVGLRLLHDALVEQASFRDVEIELVCQIAGRHETGFCSWIGFTAFPNFAARDLKLFRDSSIEPKTVD